MIKAKAKAVRISPQVLSRTAGLMLPFYRRIAGSRNYALRWSKAVRTVNLRTLERLLREAVPPSRWASLSTNGIGYFLDISYPKPVLQYTNGTSIRPGTTQFYFDTPVHRAIARAILPLYRKLASDVSYAALVLRASRTGNRRALGRLIRCRVKTPYLISVRPETEGFSLGFRFPGSRFTVYNQFFHSANL